MQEQLENKTILHRQTVIYLPTFFRGNYRRLGNHYGDTWYYKLQQAVLEYLATRQDYYFIWKGLVASDGCYNPIPQWIKDRGFDNIGIETEKPFQKFLLIADKVICDYPSTGLYEAVTAGIPTVALCYRAFTIRETAREVFGEILQDFTTYDEAIRHIKNFLDHNPGLCQININMGAREGFEMRLAVEATRMANGGEERDLLPGISIYNFPLLLLSAVIVIFYEIFVSPIDYSLAQRRSKKRWKV